MDKAVTQKERLDVLMVSRGLAESREQARRLILAGKVTVSGARNPKPGQQYATDSDILVQAPEKYVSRGGLKLEAALSGFKVEVTDTVCADIGASTGGFTDCFLQHGAARVFAVDVGASQMHPRLQKDERVTLVEHTNAREISREKFAETPSVCAIDVSFISLTKILPALRNALDEGAQCIALIKPQFEADRVEVSRGKGIIRDPAVHRRILIELLQQMPAMGWRVLGLLPSPITGGSGNREFLAHLVAIDPAEASSPSTDIDIDAVLRQPS
jgi:23S rRNA (cytidine1920-2'-O)/16S rRNA (cytidine1409-2'-O)-methyltransferase